MHTLVVGAGPAGSLSAILLARAGQRVTLVEQSRFPRDKVCGECLSALGRTVLRRHGLERRLLDAGAVDLTRADLVASDARATLDLPEPMLGLSRRVMDQILLDAARDAGAQVRQPARVIAAVPASAGDGDGRGGQEVSMRDLLTSRVETLEADLVVVADGRGALLGDAPEPTGDLGIKAHYEAVDADPRAITLYACAGCYGGVAPIEDGRWNVAFAVPASRVREARGDIEGVFARIVESNTGMTRAFGRARRVNEWLASPLPRFAPRGRHGDTLIPVGNAAAAIEPIGGEGMGLALRSAELAVDAIVNDKLHELPARYARLWRTRSIFCRLGAMVMSRPIAPAGVELTRIVPHRALMSLVGK